MAGEKVIGVGTFPAWPVVSQVEAVVTQGWLDQILGTWDVESYLPDWNSIKYRFAGDDPWLPQPFPAMLQPQNAQMWGM